MSEEFYVIVDEKDNVLEKVPNTDYDPLERTYSVRTVAVLVFDSKERLLLQFCQKHKKISPGTWDSSAGGHVNFGETYKQAALRELNEELGITASVKDLTFVKKLYLNDRLPLNNVHSSIFKLVFDGKIKFNENEISEVKWFSMNEIREMLKENNSIFSRHLKEILFYCFNEGSLYE
ncbi:MAG: NUDIX domain-containing protein [archaeon]